MAMRRTIRRNIAKTRRQSADRSGFTLVEMLISVTLVLLMMTMFSSIFGTATKTVTIQKGIAQNNQKARALVTTIRADLAKRSMRYGLPFYPTESAAVSPSAFGNRSGYLYISTNDPDSWQDDILQFTVDVRLTQESTDDTLYFGAAKLLYDLTADPLFAPPPGQPRRTNLRSNPNQPDADDGRMIANEVGASSAAEVSYFIRNGALYRRVMLLREPLAVAGFDLATQPVSTVGNNPYQRTQPPPGGLNVGGVFAYVASPRNVDPTLTLGPAASAPGAWNTIATNDFWANLDYSATPVMVATGGSPASLPGSASFNGIDALDNSLGFGTALGNPSNRFGFNIVTGLSREHDNTGAARLFIGRFTHAETSHPDFNYPLAACRTAGGNDIPVTGSSVGAINSLNSGAIIGNGNPMDVVGTPLALNQSTGVLTQFAGASGRGGGRSVEDLLLANVHGMRIEIWDERLQRFAQPAHTMLTQVAAGGALTPAAGDYHVSRRLNGAHGPLGTINPAANRVFDTWHSGVSYDYDGDGMTTNNELTPPFIAYRYYPPRAGDPPVTAGGTYGAPCGPGPSPNTMTNPYTEVDVETGQANKNKGYWVGSDFSDPDPMNWVYHNYNVGDVIFAVPGFDGDMPDEIFEWDQDTIPATAFQIGFRCVRPGYASDPTAYGATGQPSWPRVPGQKTTEAANAVAVGVPAIWESFDNRRPLKAIKLSVQFFDQNTEKLRQLSFVLPMTTDR